MEKVAAIITAFPEKSGAINKAAFWQFINGRGVVSSELAFFEHLFVYYDLKRYLVIASVLLLAGFPDAATIAKIPESDLLLAYAGDQYDKSSPMPCSCDDVNLNIRIAMYFEPTTLPNYCWKCFATGEECRITSQHELMNMALNDPFNEQWQIVTGVKRRLAELQLESVSANPRKRPLA